MELVFFLHVEFKIGSMQQLSQLTNTNPINLFYENNTRITLNYILKLHKFSLV